MSARYGPVRLVLLHCGKFDFADVELDCPLHLIGPNNVGKTSLIALLQFLYLDDQRAMHFARDLAETRRYYFPETHSYVLFECLTPTGFQVLGVRGLGPVRQYELTRFAYQGRIELDDFLTAERAMRSPEEIDAGLSAKGFLRLEPRHLRGALTGLGENRGAALGLVPSRNRGAYDRFRKIFGNLLRLSHLKQEELKQLLLDVNEQELRQRSIDLVKNYQDSYERVKRDSLEVRELKLLQGDIELLLGHLERRTQARGLLPGIWQAVGEGYHARRAAWDDAQRRTETRDRELTECEASVRSRTQSCLDERSTLDARRGTLQGQLQRLTDQQGELADFVPDWAEVRIHTVRQRLDVLAYQLQAVHVDPPERVHEQLEQTEETMSQLRQRLSHLGEAAVTHLRRHFSEPDLEDLFSLLNPDLLGLPVNVGISGIRVKEEVRLVEQLRRLLVRPREGVLAPDGAELDLDAVPSPDLERYLDPDRMEADLKQLADRQVRYRELLEIARTVETLRAEKRRLDDELNQLVVRSDHYAELQLALADKPEWESEVLALEAQTRALTQEVTSLEEERQHLIQERQRIQDEMARRGGESEQLRRQVEALDAPPQDWPSADGADVPGELEDLIAVYQRTWNQERTQDERVQELLGAIERRTYSRYVGADEAATLANLREQLDSIPQREQAVQELWSALAVGVRKELSNLDKDLDTLKTLTNRINRKLGGVKVSNLVALRLMVHERPQWVSLIRNVRVDEDLPLFSDASQVSAAVDAVGRLLSEHPRVELGDLFDLQFEIETTDGAVRRHHHLDAIESNGTTIAIKVLVNLLLLKDLLGSASVQIPFYLDECSSLDVGNLSSIVREAWAMGFTAVLASPDPMDAAERLYFMEEQENGRVVLEPQSAMVQLEKDWTAREDSDA